MQQFPRYHPSCNRRHHIRSYQAVHLIATCCIKDIYLSILKHSINDQPYITNANRYSRRSPVHNLSGETNRLLLGHSSGTP